MDRGTLAAARQAYAAGEIPTLDQVPCVCGAERDLHTGTTHAGGYAPNRCTRFRANRTAEIVARAAEAAEHGFGDTMAAWDRHERARRKRLPKSDTIAVRPSMAGACRRSVWYQVAPPEDYEPAPSPRGPAWMGTLIHDRFLQIRGELYPWRLYADFDDSLAVTLPGSDRGYRYDEYDPVIARLVSIKTAGGWRWDKTAAEGADEKWWDQDHLYAWALDRMGYPVQDIEILVIHRENGSDERYVEPYDPARAERVLAELQSLALEIELGMVPPRDEPGPAVSKLCSTYCPARRHCWNMDLAESLSVSPENLTLLGFEQDDEVVAEIAEELVGVRDARLAAEKDEKRLKALLDGVTLKPYGTVKPQVKGTTSTSYSAYVETIENYWEQLRSGELTPDDLGEKPPAPRQTKGTSVTWVRLTQKELKERAKALAAASRPATDEEVEEAIASSSEESQPAPLRVVSERAEAPALPELPASEAS